MGIKGFNDCIAIYKEDGRWIAHSIETDQIGVDKDMVLALADLIKTVKTVLAMSEKDKTIAYLRKAPQDIIDKVNSATPLPKSIFEAACEIEKGEWHKKDVSVSFKPLKKSFSIQNIMRTPTTQAMAYFN